MTRTAVARFPAELLSRGKVRMLLPGEMTRIRRQELLAEAERERSATRFRRGRRWGWLAEFAAARAEHARRGG